MFIDELKKRNLLGPCIGNVEEHLKSNRTGYVGFDPTADSLTVGHLLMINIMIHFRNAGNFPIILLGGSTALIGDPSGKDGERELLNAIKVDENIEKLTESFKRFIPDVHIVNNESWLDKMHLVTFLRECKHFPVNELLNRGFVSKRLEGGISYTEFSYSILQAYDFLHLRHTTEATIQFGGEDQYGNIATGVSYGKRKGCELFGITCPLLLDKNGKKFGKTEEGSIFLDRNKTSPYEFWQFWFNVPDSNVIDYLKKFTFMSLERISDIEKLQKEYPEKKDAQTTLANEVTRFVHSEEEVFNINAANKLLFGKEVKDLTKEERAIVKKALGVEKFRYSSVEDMLFLSFITSSKREARTLIEQKGVQIINFDDCTFVRRGKRNWKVIEKE